MTQSGVPSQRAHRQKRTQLSTLRASLALGALLTIAWLALSHPGASGAARPAGSAPGQRPLQAALAGAPTNTPTPTSAVTSTATPTATLTPTGTPTPGPLVRWKSDLDTGTGFVTSLGLFILGILVFLVGLVTAGRLIYLLIGRFRTQQLVIPDFVNNSGVADLDKMLSALTIVARQKVPSVLADIRTQMKSNPAAGVPNAMLAIAPVPQDVPGDSFQTLADAVAGVGSSQVQGITRLVNALLPQRGLVVNGYLMLRGQSPGTFGMAIRISALSQNAGGKRFVLWESPQTVSALADAGSKKVRHNPSRLHRLLVRLGLVHDPAPPPGPDPGSVALTALGAIYRDRGAFADAKTQFEASMQKAPPDAQAGSALASVLDMDWTPSQRVLRMLEPVVVAMAIEVARRAVEDARPYRRERERPRMGRRQWKQERIKRYEAQVDNFFGAFYQSRAQSLNYPPFLDASIPLFRQAIGSNREWYQPYENLATTYWLLAASQGTADAVTSLSRALHEFKRARARVEAGDAAASRRITIGESRAEMLLAQKTGQPLTRARQLITDLVAPWQLADETDAWLLYNLASWYAVDFAIEKHNPDLLLARRYLVYSLARDLRSNEAWVRQDPDFEPLRPWLARMLPVLHARLEQQPPLKTLKGQAFQDAIDLILQTARP